MRPQNIQRRDTEIWALILPSLVNQQVHAYDEGWCVLLSTLSASLKGAPSAASAIPVIWMLLDAS